MGHEYLNNSCRHAKACLCLSLFWSAFGIVTSIFFLCTQTVLAFAQSPTYDDVSKVFKERCVMCHSGQNAPLGLQLDSLPGILMGSKNGPVVITGKPDSSELIRRLRGESQPRMPLTGPPYLSEEEIGMMAAWIARELPEGVESEEKPPEKPQAARQPGQPVRFSDVAPIFLSRCAKCHSQNSILGAPPEGFIVTTRDQILESAERVHVIPGVPGASLLVRHILGTSLPRMPLDGPPYLTQEEIHLIIEWIEQGAPDDNGVRAAIPVGARIRLRGIMTGIWELDGVPLQVDRSTRIDKNPRVGELAEVRGYVLPGGGIHATRIRRR